LWYGLSSKVPVAYIDIRTFAHATEDTEKVEKAVRNTLPTELVNAILLERSNLTGHHGNPIVLFETRIKEKNAAQKAFQKLSSELSIMDKDLLSSEIKRHLEKGNLYIRLDKQSAYMNELRICQIDPIHFKVHFKRHETEEMIEICRKYGLIP
jgi:RNA binding exosome subunit